MILCVIQPPAGMSEALSRMLHKNLVLKDNGKRNIKWKEYIIPQKDWTRKCFRGWRAVHWPEYADLGKN